MTARKPLLLLRLSGLLLLRFADRQLLALLFQLPPRFTRFEPMDGTPEIVDFRLMIADYPSYMIMFRVQR
jgi:hypothetical protein